MQQYVKTLLREIEATPSVGQAPLETVFLGGGTPSLLSVSQLESILNALDMKFGIARTAEVSIEMDPATFDLAHLEGYAAAGVNRVSLGAQDFHDEVLAACGRFHRREDVWQAVGLLHKAGLENFSLDLMSGLPHQTMESWAASLKDAIALQPTHISQYDLIVEPQTAFSRYYTPGEAPLPTDTQTADMYRAAKEALCAAGYDHYEICNYAKRGYEARHNITYWKSQPCYGFGMGATSYVNHQRIDRPRTQRSYRAWVEQFISGGGRTDDPIVTPEERVLEQIMVGLRLKEGIALEDLYEVYGQRGLDALGSAIAPHVRSHWLIVETNGNVASNIKKLEPTSQIRLSDPEGFVMSNQVIVDAFNALEK